MRSCKKKVAEKYEMALRWPTTVTAKEKDTRQKEEPYGKKEKTHGKRKNITAKEKNLTAKRKDSCRKKKPLLPGGYFLSLGSFTWISLIS